MDLKSFRSRSFIFPTSVCTVGGTDATHFHVGTLDLNRFYSSTVANTGSSGTVIVAPAAYQRRLAALAIVNSLGKPDILSVQEVQNLQTFAGTYAYTFSATDGTLTHTAAYNPHRYGQVAVC